MLKILHSILFLSFLIPLHAQVVKSHVPSTKYYGTYVFEKQLAYLFPKAQSIFFRGHVSKLVDKIKDTGTGNIIIITRNYLPSDEDISTIRNYTATGGNVFIAATTISSELESSFNIQSEDPSWYVKYITLLPQKSLAQAFTDTIEPNGIASYDRYFNYFDTSEVIALGINNKRRANFLRIPQGKGNIFIHLYPDIFTNLFLLHKQYSNYTESVLSFLPKNVSKNYIYLHEITERLANTEKDEEEPEGQKNFYSFIRNQPNLWAAFLVGLLSFFLAILFALKRKQRVVPIVEPVKNNSLEFAQTIRDLYFFHKNNYDMAIKKITHWQDFIRHKYLIKESLDDEHFWNSLTKKTGIDSILISNLKKNVLLTRQSGKITDKQLFQLSNAIDTFYK